MILYSTGTWGVGFIFRYYGSVFPKAACWALPNAALAIVLHYLIHPKDEKDEHTMSGVNFLFAAWSGVLGFLVVFRNNQAYGRFWEGAAVISQVRGNWFNAVSNLMAFSSSDPKKNQQITDFQNILVRLSSMLYCAALQQICDLRDDTMEIIDPRGMSPESLEYLQSTNDRCEIILQWIQHLIVDAARGGVVDIAPPILSRVFQELSNGIVSLNNVRKIHDIPFPFPYAQMITCMLIIQWCFTPIFAAYVVKTSVWAAIMCFLYTWCYACLIYIPNEIDQPFGSDANDLPLAAMQRDYNKSLLHLLEPLAQKPPTYENQCEQQTKLLTVESGFALRSVRKSSVTSLSSRTSNDLAQALGNVRRSIAGFQNGEDPPSSRKSSKDSPGSPDKSAKDDESKSPPYPSQRSDFSQKNNILSDVAVSNAIHHAGFGLSIEALEQQKRDAGKQEASAGSAEGCASPLQRATKVSRRQDHQEALDQLLPQKHLSDEDAKANLTFDGDWLPDLEKAAEDVVIYQHRGSLSKAAKASHKTSNDPPMTPHDLPMTRLASPLASPKTPPVTSR